MIALKGVNSKLYLSHNVHNFSEVKLCALQLFVVNNPTFVFAIGKAQTGAGIPANHDAAHVIDTANGTFCTDGWRLGVVHFYQLNAGTFGVLLLERFNNGGFRNEHTGHLNSVHRRLLPCGYRF